MTATSDLAAAGPGATRPDLGALPPPGRRSRRPGRLARSPAWPITALLIGYPIWWALGLADFTWVLFAIPMLARMVAWRTRGGRRIKVPPGFGIWLLFLVVAALGIAAITITAPGTVPSPVSHRVISFFNRLANYGGVTVMLLFAGNLTERELPRRKFAWMLGLVGLYTVAGGFAGMAMPHFSFGSPLLLALPKSIQGNSFIQASMHPGFAQVQNVLGTAGGRPKAPFDYTNIWGDCLTILLPYLIVGWWQGGSRRQRLIAIGAIVASIVPLLYSLNRGAWIGVGASVVYLAVRFAAKGKKALLGALIAVVAITGVLVVATPLQTIVISRLHHGRSNNLRSNLDSLAITDGLASPIIGYGDTRQERGSATSISIGPSYKCPSCGHYAVGSTGQLWLLLVCDGVLGAVLYLGFFAFGAWRFWRDDSPYGLAGVLVLLLSFVYIFAYDAVGAPLGMTMLAYGLMWKSSMHRSPAVLPDR